jgi:hypothetical protein
MKDDFGSYIKETSTKTVEIYQTDEETGKTSWKKTDIDIESYQVNPDYDSSEEYIQRDARPEWDAVGMLGILSVYDDGTCEVDGFCKCNDDAIATASDTGYRVVNRVTDNIIEIILK